MISQHDLRGLARAARKRWRRSRVPHVWLAKRVEYDVACYRRDLARLNLLSKGSLGEKLERARKAFRASHEARTVAEIVLRAIAACPKCSHNGVDVEPVKELAAYRELDLPMHPRARCCRRCSWRWTCAQADLYEASLEAPP